MMETNTIEGVFDVIGQTKYTAIQRKVLEEIRKAPSYHYAIATESGIPLSTVSSTLVRLQAWGLIEPCPEQDSYRGRIVYRITAKGRAALRD